MKERVSLLLKVTPRYGEILLGVACMLLENKEALLNDSSAIAEIKEYLKFKAPKRFNVKGVCTSSEFQDILTRYTNTCAAVIFDENEKIKTSMLKKEMVNIRILEFFYKIIWPIIVNHYVDNLSVCKEDVITLSINVKKNSIVTIYGEYDPNLFFEEFKDLLVYNNIVISKASMVENGDMIFDLMILIPPYNAKYKYY